MRRENPSCAWASTYDITEQKNQIDINIQERQFSELLIDSLPGLCCLYREDMEIIRWNKAVEQATGYSIDEIKCLGLQDIFDNHDRQKAMISAQETLKTGISSFEARLRMKNGKRFSYLFTTRLVHWGNANHFLTMALEIEDIKKTQAALEMQEKLLTGVLEATEDGILAIDQSNSVLHANEQFKRLWKIPRELHRSTSDIPLLEHASAQVKNTAAFLQRVNELKMSDSYETELLYLKDGTLLERHSCPLMQQGKSVGRVWSFRDVTKAKQNEDERLLLAAAIEQTGESIIITDSVGRYQYVNPVYQKTTGYSREEIIHFSLRARLLEDALQTDEFYSDVWNTISNGVIWSGRLTVKSKSGKLIQEESVISPVRHANGSITNYICVNHDITEQIHLEEQLRQAQKMEAIGQLAGGVAHDFNNLLQVIEGYTEIAITELPEDSFPSQHLYEVLEASDRARNLVNQLLLFSRRQPRQPKLLSLNKIIESILKMLGRVLGEHIEREYVPALELKPIYADPNQIEQVIINLSVNARDAMPNGGKITIATHNITLDKSFVRLNPWAREGAFTVLMVEDNGCGISPELMKRIFEPFFSTKAVGKGTGLGLATVYGIVEQHDGFLHVKSTVDKGTLFQVYFPIADGTFGEIKNRTVDWQFEKGNGETILFAEDDESICTMVLSILEKAGYKTLVAHDGEEAIQLFETHGNNINLVILDGIMPKKNGREVYDAIVSLKPETPVLFASGYSYDVIGLDGLGEGIDLLSKPFRPYEFMVKIQGLLKKEQ